MSLVLQERVVNLALSLPVGAYHCTALPLEQHQPLLVPMAPTMLLLRQINNQERASAFPQQREAGGSIWSFLVGESSQLRMHATSCTAAGAGQATTACLGPALLVNRTQKCRTVSVRRNGHASAAGDACTDTPIQPAEPDSTSSKPSS